MRTEERSFAANLLGVACDMPFFSSQEKSSTDVRLASRRNVECSISVLFFRKKLKQRIGVNISLSNLGRSLCSLIIFILV